MTRRVRPGRIWGEGETYLLEMQNGKVIQKLGTYYQQPIYRDLENVEITNITDDVITADGVRRSLVTINDGFPGPTLEVMEGSEVWESSLFLSRVLTEKQHGIARIQL